MTFNKIERARETLRNHIRRGGTIKSTRTLKLVDSYNDLRAAMRETEDGFDAWMAYCDAYGIDPHHDGYDYLA